MRMIVGLIGLTIVSVGAAALLAGLTVAVYVGAIVFGGGLVVDALRK